MTKNQRIFDSAVMISSVMPSAKNSWSASADMLMKGMTAIDGLCGMATGEAGSEPGSSDATSSPAKTNAIDVHGSRDILDLMLSQILKLKANPWTDALTYDVGHVNATWFGQGLKPCRDIHAIAVDVITFDNYVTEIDANAKGDLLTGGKSRVA
jgi:hypothetical protein